MQRIIVKLDINISNGEVEINTIKLIKGQLSGEVVSFLDVLKDTLEGMGEGDEELW